MSAPGRRTRLVARAAVVVGLVAGTVLVHRTTREHSILGRHDQLLADVLGAWCAWALALAGLVRSGLSRRGVLLVVVVGAAALRLVALTPVVPLSDDLYRYAWDGSVQAAGVDPYRYAPAQAGDVPALADRRTDWLYPDAVAGGRTCARLHRPPGCTLVNRPEVRTIYPPVAELEFVVGHLVGASHLRDLGWELVGLASDLATAALLWLVLVRSGRDPLWVAAFAWSPLAVLEGVQNGHVDGLATLFVVAAVALAGRRPAASGAALGLAAMVKLYPALLLPVLLGRRPVRVLTAFVAVCVASYLPHVLAAGARVLGYLPGYLHEEDYGAGSRYLLLHPLGLPAHADTALVALLGLAVAVRVLLVARRAAPVDGGAVGVELAPAACLLLGAALLLGSPAQPWYGLPLAALAALAARPAWLVVPALAYPLFFAVVPAGPSEAATRTGATCYLLALAVVLAAGARHRRSRARQHEAAGPGGAGATTWC